MKTYGHLFCLLSGVGLLVLGIAGCPQRPDAPPAAAPAVEKPKPEADLARTTVSTAMASSLGVRTEPVRTGPVQEHLTLTGWVMARPGNEVTVTAPLAGYVRAANGRGVPVAGLAVAAGQELVQLEPVLAPLEQVQLAALKRGYESELTKAREAVAVAQSEYDRVKDLVLQKLRGQQDLEQAHARLKSVQEDLAAALDKKRMFADGPDGAAYLRPVSLKAPRAGTLLTLHVAPGQYVAAAAPIATIADLSSPWLRVPVPEGDLPRLHTRTPARVTLRTPPTPAGPSSFEVAPVALVPQVDPVKHTADMLYELKPAAGLAFARDQTLTVQVPVGSERLEALVPYAAVVFDAYAGTWVYLERKSAKDGERLFERKRVELGPTIGDDVVVRPALKTGERVVVAGAAALFSREFHKPPSSQPGAKVEDDDD
jgi:RND family efflux transporter MFP subunit